MPSLDDTSFQTFWQFSPEEMLTKLGVDQNEGLNDVEAKERIKIFGGNVLSVRKSSSSIKLLLTQFNSPLIYLLLFAALLSLVLYESTDALIIIGIILISTVLSFFQEKGAVNAMEKLLKIVQIKTTVIRNHTKKEIPIEEVVPGDIVELSAGDIIPGDCHLLTLKDLYVDEATLTGETFYAEKIIGTMPADAPIAKRQNSLFMGTHVVSGTAKALVVKTGKNTEFGKISERLSLAPPENEFEHGIRRFGYFLMELTFVLLLIIFAFNIYFNRPVIESILFALSLSVGLTPQLLPAIITINLAHGAKKMAQSNVIVKKLASIENFGSMNILCSDKTGTLTTGEIELKLACDYSGTSSDIVSKYAYLNAFFQSGYTNPIDNAILGNKRCDVSEWRKIDEVPYDFVRKRLSLLVQNGESRLIITKGAFQQIIEICTNVETPSGDLINIQQISDDLQKCFVEYCNAGYRVLGICYRNDQKVTLLTRQQETGMTFLGFLLFWDPIKEGVESVVEKLKNLGVGLKIITGDNKLVALHVAKLLGVTKEQVLTGPELYKLSDRALFHQVSHKAIFAEIEPNQKERIILALRKAGNVVGYLGDGINDVTALHAADVSISVDSAADAAKEVANIVLMEKDLSVLKEGIKAGRMTFANTLKYIFMASSANFGNMFSMAGASLFLNFLPLLPKQVLLTNLMTDFPEMTISTDRVDQEMIQKPLRWNIGFIRKFMMIFGLISSIFDYATFGVLLLMKANIEEFRTGWFLESVISATLIVLVIRTFKPFFTSMPSKYLLGTVILVVICTLLLPLTPLAEPLSFTTLPGKFYLIIAGIVLLYIFIVELAKKLFLKHGLNKI